MKGCSNEKRIRFTTHTHTHTFPYICHLIINDSNGYDMNVFGFNCNIVSRELMMIQKSKVNVIITYEMYSPNCLGCSQKPMRFI